MVQRLTFMMLFAIFGVIAALQMNIAMKMSSKWVKTSSTKAMTSLSMHISSPSIFTNIFSRNNRRKASFQLHETVEKTVKGGDVSSVDFSQFAVGQEYEAKALAVKKFGVFVDIGKGVNVLLPRSTLSNNAVTKLQKAVDEKLDEKIKIELIGVSATNRTLSGKILGDQGAKRDRSKSATISKDLESKTFNATVVSIHDFGVFAELDDMNVDGLIPMSKLPYGTSKSNVKELYKKGMKVVVKVESVNEDGKKMILSARNEESRIDVSRSLPGDMASDKWIQGVVQNTAPFGVFIRPAGMDTTGLLHNSRIPRDLMAALKKMAPIPPGTNKTDVEMLFSAGDIFKIRVQSINQETGKMELSALPYTANQDDEDDFVVIEDEDEEKEGEEGKKRRGPVDMFADDSISEEFSGFNALDVLVWWRGKAFEKATAEESEVDVDEEAEVVSESRDVVEGTWRRLFELDMRQDEADFSAKAMEAEIRELDEEIGELNGLDDELGEEFGLGSKFNGNRVGANIALSSLPSEWRDQVEFFKESSEAEKIKSTGLKGGKKFEQLELEAMVREIEMDLERASKAKRSAATDAPLAPQEVASVVEVEAPVPPESA